jgi:hypothetical protein
MDASRNLLSTGSAKLYLSGIWDGDLLLLCLIICGFCILYFPFYVGRNWMEILYCQR